MKTTIKDKLIILLENIFDKDSIDECINLGDISLIDDLLMDSVGFISLIIGVEDAFEITIPDELLIPQRFDKIDEIVDIIYGLAANKNAC